MKMSFAMNTAFGARQMDTALCEDLFRDFTQMSYDLD